MSGPDLYAAVDLRGGRFVRLWQGDYEQETEYGDDPVAVAEGMAAEGAAWIHVVDLDAARTGKPENRSVVTEIANAVDVPVQAGGGIRSEDAAEDVLASGVARVVFGTAAVESPDLVAALAHRHPGAVAVGLDARGGVLASRGWTKVSDINLEEAVHRFEGAGVAAYVVTDIDRDGTLEGPDLEGLEAVLAATAVPVVGSGGVASLDDLRALARLRAEGRGLAGVVVGRALYEAAFTVAEAVEVLQSEGQAAGP